MLDKALRLILVQECSSASPRRALGQDTGARGARSNLITELFQ